MAALLSCVTLQVASAQISHPAPQVPASEAPLAPPAEELSSGAADVQAAAADRAHPAEAAFRQGVQSLAAEEPRTAARAFESALARGYRPPADAYLQLGLAYQRIPLEKFRAIRAFRAAARADPTALEPLYRYAETYLWLDGWEGQREARRALVSILKEDPLYRDAFERWQALYLDSGEHADVARALRSRLASAFDARVAALTVELLLQLDDAAGTRELLDEWEARELQPSAVRRYYRARQLFLEQRDEEATESFFSGLGEARSAEDLEAYRRDVEPLLAPEERESLSGASAAEQAAFLRAFWDERDPLPFSAENERLREHYRRIGEVRRRYLWKKPLAKEKVVGDAIDDLGRPSFETRVEGRSLDDRGTIYLLHGEPDWRHLEVGGSEYWRYDRPELPGGRLQFHFRRMDGPMGRGNDAVYSVAPTTDLGAANTRAGRAGRQDLENAFRALFTDSYVFQYGENRFPLAWTSASFRNAASRGRTDLVLAIGMPLSALRKREGAAAGELLRRLEVEGVDGEPRDAVDAIEETPSGSMLERTLTLSGYEGGTGTLVDAVQVSAAPGERRFALQVESRRSGAFGLERGELAFPSYAAPGLQLSDLLFASRVSAAAEEGPVGPAAGSPAAVVRAGSALQPLAGTSVSRRRPLHLYYEIYDLAGDESGRARYRLEYRLTAERKLGGKPPRRIFGGGREAATGRSEEVSLTFQRELAGPAERVAETIALDLSSLAPGRHRIGVAVQDLVSGATVERELELQVLEGRESDHGMGHDR